MTAPLLLDITGSIRQAIDLLDRLPESLFSKAEPPVYEGSIGAHLRHNIDHYHSFCQGLQEGSVDYDRRRRDPRLERDQPLCRTILEGVVTELSQIDESSLDRPLRVKMDCGDRSEWTDSSVKRELQFLLSHTVHHYAIIAMICRMQGHVLPDEFGVAASTLKFRQAQQQQQQACAH